MTQKHLKRGSRHPWIETVWQTLCLSDGVYRSTPDGLWDLIYRIAADGRGVVFLAGQGKAPIDVPYSAGEYAIVISFAPHVYVEQAVPLSSQGLQFVPVEADGFVLNGTKLPLPTFENAEDVTDLMVQAGLLRSDDLIAAAFTSAPKAASERALQDRFKRVTGITQRDFQMIRRAQEAVRRLKAGEKPAAVAADLGFTDQPHMIRSIKKVMGYLPSNLEAVHKI